MGYGSYSHEAHSRITKSREGKSREQMFEQRKCHPLMDPKGVTYRESLDSEAHPESLGIIFALDVTGSMGNIPEGLAKDTMPTFMKAMMDLGVADPQVLFMAVGDVRSDAAPLQVGQFESEAELMDKWLTLSYLEGGGGPWGQESYEMAVYFAARHTKMACWEKRHKRGYLFITGDEEAYPSVTNKYIEKVLGEDLGTKSVSLEKLLAEADERFQTFFLVPDERRAKKVKDYWGELLHERFIVMESPDLTAATAAALVGICEDKVRSASQVAETLIAGGADETIAKGAARAVEPFAHWFASQRD